MVLKSPFGVKANSQYDRDSAPNEPYNCGPTTVTNVLLFHQDRDYPINETRRLATTANGRGTRSAERKVMFDKRGTPAEVVSLTPSEVRQTLNGLRTMDMALLMSKIARKVRVRPFRGAHSVAAIGVGRAKCPMHGVVERGLWVDNPDFHASRGEVSRYFYPDHEWVPAFKALGSWCVRPKRDKVISTRVPFRHDCKLRIARAARSGPGMAYSRVKRLPEGFRFKSIELEKEGGTYQANGRVRTDWVSFNLNGRLVWVKRAYVKVI